MIDILMAVYNGEAVLERQIDSLLAQTAADWRLLIRDDGSTDGSAHICQQYSARFPEKIRLLNDERGNLGVLGNFNQLLRASDADYIMFCDQDDVWFQDKVQKTFAAMVKLEREGGGAAPSLVYTDARMVDQNLRSIADSWLNYINRAPNFDIAHICVESPVYANTAMINRALKELAGAVPKEAIGLDAWLALCAAVFGKISFLNEPTLLYVRGPKNVSGVGRYGLDNYLSRSLSKHREKIYNVLRQCEAFHDTFAARLSPELRRLLADAARIPRANWAMRRYLLLRHRLFKTGALRNIGMLIVI